MKEKEKRKSLWISLFLCWFIALLMSGCGGGGGSDGGELSLATYTLSGNVYDDLLKGATVSFYLQDTNTPTAQTVTDSEGNYSLEISVDRDEKVLYGRATGGKLATTGEEFQGALYSVVPLEDADPDSGALQVQVNPLTSMLRLYMNPDNTLDDAVSQLNMKLQQIDGNSPLITRSSLSQYNHQHDLVRRLSNLMRYQIDQEDPQAGTIDQVMARVINNEIDITRLRQSLPLAVGAVLHGKGELAGKVVDLYTGDAIQGATVGLLGTAFRCYTDLEGNFFFRQLPAGLHLIVEVTATGYANNQIVTEVSPAETNQGITVKLKAITSRVELDLEGGGINARYNARIRDLDDDRIQVSTMDGSMAVTFSREVLHQIRRGLSRTARYAESYPAVVYVNITPLDPTQEIEAFPGDFATSDPAAAGEGREKKLESVVLGEFSLEDEHGQPLQLSDLDLDDVEVRLRLPDSLQEIYRQRYDQGERFIPWYAYNRTTAIWELSDRPAELILAGEALYAVAEATHFSWWNVDWPVETHGCIHGHVYRKAGVPAVGVQVKAAGVDYQGENSSITDSNGYYNLRVKRDAWSRISAQIGSYVISDPNAVYVSEPVCSDYEVQGCCERVDLNFNLVDICGQVVDHLGAGLHGAYVYADTGVGKFTDTNGGFRLASSGNRTIKLKVSYTRNNITYFVDEEIAVGTQDLCGDQGVTITLNLAPKYIRGTVSIVENGLPKPLQGKEVKICADNGFTTTNKADGSYAIVVEQGTPAIGITYRYYAVDGTYLEQRRTVTWDTAALRQKVYGLTGVDDSDKEGVDVEFVVNPVRLYGSVTNLSGQPVAGARISTTLGKYTLSDESGEYEILVPANMHFFAVAKLVIPQAGLQEEDRREVFTSLTEAVVNFVLDDRVARVTGQVKEADGGPLLSGVEVRVITESGAHAFTDPNGYFSCLVPSEQTVKMAFSCGDHYPQTRLFETPARGNTELVHDLNSDYIELARINHRPVIKDLNIQPGLKVCPEDEVTLDIVAVDIDPINPIDPNDIATLTYSVSSPVGTVIQDANRPSRFTWTAPSEAGWWPLTVQVSDGNPENSTSIIRLQIEVMDCTVVIPNQNPVILSITPLKPVTNLPGETRLFSVVAYDPDGDPLSYRWQVYKKAGTYLRFLAYDPNHDLIPDWGDSLADPEFDPNGRITRLTIPDVFTDYQLDANQPADFAVCITVEDGRGGKIEKEQTLTVLSNRPPLIKIMTVEPGQCLLGDQVKFKALATDPDGIISYTWYHRGIELGSTSDPNSYLSWTPTNPDPEVGDVGDLNIQLVVRDGHPTRPLSQTQYLRLVVKNNSAPLVTLNPSKTNVLPGEVVDIDAIVTDPEGRLPSCTWSVSGGEITSGQGTCQITWQAPQLTGDYRITLTASDGFHTVTTGPDDLVIRVAEITVNAGQDQMLILEDGMPSVSVPLKAAVGILPPDEPYTVLWQIDANSVTAGAVATVLPAGDPNTTFTADTAGSYRLWVTATMTRSGFSVRDEVQVQVNNQAPPTVFGWIKDAQGIPVSGALVEIYSSTGRENLDRQTTTDESGYYAFSDIPPGTYYIVVARDGYLQMTQQITIY